MKDFKIKEGVYIRVISEEDTAFIKNNVFVHNRYKQLKNKEGVEDTKKAMLDKFKLDVFSIIAYGETNDISGRILSKIIDTMVISSKGVIKTTYTIACKCFRTIDKNIRNRGVDGYSYDNTILHEEKIASWACLLEQINNPKHVLIYKT